MVSRDSPTVLPGLRSSSDFALSMSISLTIFFFSSSKALISFLSWFSAVIFSFIAPEYCVRTVLPVFLLAMISRINARCSSRMIDFSNLMAYLSALSFSRPCLCFWASGFSSNFLGFSGGTVSKVISCLFQLNLGLSFLGGRSFLGRYWAVFF